MNNEMELLREKLEKLISVSEDLTNCEVVSLSQELDKLIFNFYLN